MSPRRNLETSRLVTFVEVARLGSISAAARVLGLTPSAVSQQISALERACEVDLVQREPRGVSLTGAGQVLLAQAEGVVRVLEETDSTMSQLSGKVSGRVRAGSIASAAVSIVLPAIGHLAHSAPEVVLSVTTMEPSQSLESVLSGRLDMAVIDVYDHVPVPLPEHLLVEEVLTEPLVIVSPSGAELPRVPTLAALKDHDWVMPPADAACGAATRHACRAVGFEPRVRWETDDMLVLVAAVSRGEGIALLPRRAVPDTGAPVSIRPPADPVLHRRILAVSRHVSANRPAVRACLDAVAHIAHVALGRPRSG